MTLEELFNSSEMSLPKEGFDDKRETFDEYLGSIFSRYRNLLEQIDDPSQVDLVRKLKSVRPEVDILASAIRDSAHSFLAGHVNEAYERLADRLNAMEWVLFETTLSERFTCDPNDPFAQYWVAMRRPNLYRIRVSTSDYGTLKREDIFHVPYEKRRLVNNQRYSISGLPCLYFGSSVWTCWEELGRPPIDTVWLSRFQFAEDAKILDFQFPPHHFWRIFRSLLDARIHYPQPYPGMTDLQNQFSPEFVVKYLACWPLLAACAVRRENRLGTFVPEYIVPQLVLQWVSQRKEVDGIRYFSVRMPSKGFHVLAHSNCVFPVQTSSHSGYCPILKRHFSLTDPIPLDVLRNLNLNHSTVMTRSIPNAWAQVKLNEDLDIPYSQTEFFNAESKLEHLISESSDRCRRLP